MLKLNNVAIGYHGRNVVEAFSLDIHKGEILGVMGQNGSGKSTFLKSLFGELPIVSGELTLYGRELDCYPALTRARLLSMLEAAPSCTFSLSVRELLELGIEKNAALNSGSEILFKKVLNLFGLSQLAERDLLEISSGEQQRAFLAHTLASGAEYILLDEPFSHLDWHMKAKLCDVLLQWRREFGTTFVMALHELEWLPRLADKVLALGDRRVLCYGSPIEVLQNEAVRESFDFQSLIDDNPLDGSRRLTLGRRKK